MSRRKSSGLKPIRVNHRQYDPKHHLNGFETRDQAKARRVALLDCLSRGGRKDRELARKIGRCNREYACESLACPLCMRTFRRWFVSEAAFTLVQCSSTSRER